MSVLGGVLRKADRRWVIAGAVLAFFIFLSQEARVFDLTDAYWLKSCFKLREVFRLGRAKDVPIVLVPVTSQSIEKLGAWPWKRTAWGEITRRLERGGARVIAYDIDFSTPESEDSSFAQALQRNVLLPLWFEYVENGKANYKTPPIQAGFPSPPLFSKSRQGFVNVQTGTLGTRRAFVEAQYQGKMYPSFALQAYLMYNGIPFSSVVYAGRKMKVEDLAIPVDRDGSLWINYSAANFERVPAEALLDPKFPEKDVFKGKIVLIGVTSPLGQDIKITPAGSMSGLEIHAQILTNMIQKNFIAPLNPYLEFFLMISLGVICGVLLPLYAWRRFLPWVCFSLFAIVPGGFLAFVFAGVFVDVFPPTLLLLSVAIPVVLIQSRGTEVVLVSKIEELKMISQVSQLHTGNLSLDELLASALQMIEEVMQVNTLGILLKDESGRLVLTMSRGVAYDSYERALYEQEGICGRVASSGKPAHVEDIQSDPRATKFEKKLNVASFLAVPLVAKEECLGVLWVGLMEGSFDDDALIRLTTVASQLAISVENCALSRKLSQLYLDSIRALMRAVEYHIPSSKGHSERVASYSIMIAKACNLPAEEIETVRSAALLHDIGRMGHFESMYRKPDGLTEKDWKQIFTPLKSGLKILEPLSGQFPVLPILYHFYERYDGKGFPDGLKGDSIPIGSRILALANAFDDISANSPQLGEVSLGRAVQEIRKEAGTLFDPNLVRLFVTAISHIPADELTRSMKPAV